jgi:hypothetical protein
MTKDAIISECGQYRYWLRRTWDDKPPVVFVMLNPSTADAEEDDPTIRKCVRLAKHWNHGGIYVVNLFALRSSSPYGLKKVDDPIGPKNDTHIDATVLATVGIGGKAIVSWGASLSQSGFKHIKRLYRRMDEVLGLLKGVDLHCVGKTDEGFPRHPLFVREDTQPELFRKAKS